MLKIFEKEEKMKVKENKMLRESTSRVGGGEKRNKKQDKDRSYKKRHQKRGKWP